MHFGIETPINTSLKPRLYAKPFPRIIVFFIEI